MRRLFHDSRLFDLLGSRILPGLIGAHAPNQPLRVWVAGCGTGEEVYSLAVLLLEVLSALKHHIPLQIFGSDPDERAVAYAREGLYPKSIRTEVSPARLARFFNLEAGGYRIQPELRTMIVFTVQDLVMAPPLASLDLISCRHLPAHLKPEARVETLLLFHAALRAGGLLMLARSETAGALEDRFAPISKLHPIYRRIDHRPRKADLHHANRLPSHRLSLSQASARQMPGFVGPPKLMRPESLASSPGKTSRSRNRDSVVPDRPLPATEECQRPTPGDLQNILDNAGVATLLLDQELNIRFFTPAMGVLLRIVPEDIGHPLSDLNTLAVGQDLARDAFAVLAGAEPIQRHIEIGDGSWVRQDIHPFRPQHGRVEGVIVTFNDISPAMLASRDAKEARCYSDNIAEMIREPLVLLDASYRIVSGNRAFFTDFGLDPTGSIGDELRLGAVPQAEMPGLCAFLNHLEPENAANYTLAVKFPRRGTRRFVVHARCIQRDLPDPRQFLLMLEDITDQNQAGGTPPRTQIDPDPARRGKSRLLASASHDLRQPLQTIRLLRDLLEQKVTDPGALELLARLDDSASVMVDILNALLDIDEIESGAVRPNVSNVPVARLLERMEAEFGYQAQALALGWRVVPCSVSVRSDPRLLEQMIRNLLTNALKFTAKHSCGETRGRVLLGCRRRDDKLLIQIWDDGPGIPREKLATIFEEFYQINNPARERRNGLGLGLSIVKRLADLLDHNVRVESWLGKGSVFSIELPIARVQPTTEPARDDAGQRTSTVPAAAGTVLVVEDDPATRELLEMVLIEAGYTASTAPDGWSAVNMVSRGLIQPDAVIVDFNLPNGANGVHTVALLRQRLGADLPAMILTGDLSPDTLREIAASGCHRLTKPADTREMLRTLRALLGGAKPSLVPPPPPPRVRRAAGGREALPRAAAAAASGAHQRCGARDRRRSRAGGNDARLVIRFRP